MEEGRTVTMNQQFDRKGAFVVGIWAAYALAFFPLYRWVSGPALSLSIVPVAATSTAVAVNMVNHITNTAYFVTNTTGSNAEVVYDGLTVILDVTAPVTPNVANHIKLVIGDGGDDAYDSGVFLEAGSFSATALDVSKSVDDATPNPGQLITYTLVVDSHSSVSSTNTLISDTLPAGLTFAGPVTLVPPQPGATLAEGADDLPALASGVTITARESIILTFPITVNASLSDSTVIRNTAAVTSTEVVTPVTGMVAVTVVVPLELSTFFPARNAVAAPLDGTVVLTYNQEISATSVTSRTVAVHSMMQGLVTATHSVADNVVTVAPGHHFFPGELVYAIATTQTTNLEGAHPVTSTLWQFTTGNITNRCVEGFTDISAGLTGVYWGSVAWGDYDNDGDLDILLVGRNGSSRVSQVYRNDGGNFIDISAGLTEVRAGGVAWGDYDNDGDLDILLSGDDGSSWVSQVYRNDGGNFIDISAGLTGVYWGSVAWGDYDNDGDLDILLTGEDNSFNPVSQVYRNDDGNFTDISAGLTGVYLSSAAWGDYDNDGDLDILLSGDTDPGRVSQVYRNDDGSFTDISAALTGVRYSSVAWGDYDNDADLDILLSGLDNSANRVSQVCRNDGGSFTDISAGLIGVYWGSVAWGDYDNDGDLDILLVGRNGSGRVSQVYRNDGGNFIDISAGLTGVYQSSVAWGDYDNDGDLDILLSGSNGSSGVSHLWRNDDCAADLSIIKTVTPANAAPGKTITYTLAFSNTGAVTTTGVLIADSVPISVTNPMVIGSNGVAITLTGNAPYFVWEVANLALGQGGVITLTGVLSEPLVTGVVTNTAEITCAEAESDEFNNSSDTALTVQNVAPLTEDDKLATDEDTSVTISPLSNDSDGNGDDLSIDNIDAPAHGTATISGTAQVVYTPTLNYNGPDSFTYTVSDSALTNTATISITVNPVDDPPVADDATDSTDEDTAATGALTVTDPDAGDTHTYGVTTQPEHGSASVDVSGEWTYTPANRTASYDVSFTLTVTDSTDLSDTATVTISVTADNDPLSAGDDTAATGVDTPVSDALTVDDPDINDSFSYGLITPPDRGSAKINATGVWTFTPATHTENYTVSFTLTVTDTGSNSDDATITVTVTLNDPPVANDDAATTVEDHPLALDVLDNDSDPNHDPLSIAGIGQPSHGSVINNGDTVTYTPVSGFLGTDSFAYAVSDSELTATATVTVAVVEGESADLVDPAHGSFIIIYHTESRSVFSTTIEVPVGATSAPVTLVFDEASFSTHSALPRFYFLGHYFTLEAYSGADRQPGFTFDTPITLTLYYDPCVRGTPRLRYWDDGWKEDGVTVVEYDRANHKLIVTLDHLSEFALMTEAPSLSVIKIVEGPGGGVNSMLDLPLSGVVTYTIHITNSGLGIASGVILTDELPSGVTFGAWVITGSTRLPVLGNTVRWGPEDVPSGRYTIRFTAYITTNAAYAGRTITNTITYTSTNAGSGTSNGAPFIIASNTTPTISDIPDQSTYIGTVAVVPFTIGDVETPLDGLSLAAESSNLTLVPTTTLLFGGSGANRTLTITPTAGLTGTATITITVTDQGDLSDDAACVLTVEPFRIHLPLVMRN
jgi:uncharacterized repeat protein (TIGR01451 family)